MTPTEKQLWRRACEVATQSLEDDPDGEAFNLADPVLKGVDVAVLSVMSEVPGALESEPTDELRKLRRVLFVLGRGMPFSGKSRVLMGQALVNATRMRLEAESFIDAPKELVRIGRSMVEDYREVAKMQREASRRMERGEFLDRTDDSET